MPAQVVRTSRQVLGLRVHYTQIGTRAATVRWTKPHGHGRTNSKMDNSRPQTHCENGVLQPYQHQQLGCVWQQQHGVRAGEVNAAVQSVTTRTPARRIPASRL